LKAYFGLIAKEAAENDWSEEQFFHHWFNAGEHFSDVHDKCLPSSTCKEDSFQLQPSLRLTSLTQKSNFCFTLAKCVNENFDYISVAKDSHVENIFKRKLVFLCKHHNYVTTYQPRGYATVLLNNNKNTVDTYNVLRDVTNLPLLSEGSVKKVQKIDNSYRNRKRKVQSVDDHHNQLDQPIADLAAHKKVCCFNFTA